MKRPLQLIVLATMAISMYSLPATAATVIFGPQTFANATGKPQRLAATFSSGSAGCGVESTALLISNADRGVSSAIVEMNGTVLLRERDFPLSGNREIAFNALPTNTLAVTIKGGKKNSALTISVERRNESACGASIAISEPPNGFTVATRRLLVTGTASGARDPGITVNGVPAQYDLAAAGTDDDPYHWFASISPEAGPVTITARVVTENGTSTVATRSITFAPAAETIGIRGAPDSGVVPLTVNFDLSSSIVGDVVLWALDLDDDGVYERSSPAAPAEVAVTYATGGARNIRARATTADGRVFNASTIIVPQTFAEADRVIRAAWTRFTDSMARGDVAAAVTQLAGPDRQAKYRPALEALGANLPAFAAKVTDIRPIWIYGNAAHYLMVKLEDGTPFGYHVYFVRDGDGLWRVLQF